MATKATKITKDDWTLDSGLADDFDAYVAESRFGYMQEYQGGQVPLLIWELDSPDSDATRIIWPVGSGWEVTDQGQAIKHPKRSRIVRTSIYGRMIARVIEDLGVDMTGRGKPTEATVWEGMGFHFKRETLRFPGAADRGLKEEVEHLMPVVVLERREKKGITSDLEEILIELARDTEDRQTFQKAAMKLGAGKDKSLLSQVLDDSATGLWSRARKGL